MSTPIIWRRTLPRVRELKLIAFVFWGVYVGRTLPRVRELKHAIEDTNGQNICVAPFPGCVN